jgi:hypothetical protein
MPNVQYHYALVEGAVFRPLRWTDTAGEDQEFPSEIEMFRHAGNGGWELVTVYVSGKTGNYRQYYFKQMSPAFASATPEGADVARTPSLH